ncbi:MAG: hypothetical protein ACFFDN_04030 [Candidatus Hodarchaeota archaeon]
MKRNKLIIAVYLQFILLITIIICSSQFSLNGISITSASGAELSSKYTLWASHGTAICTAGNNQYYPQICSDGSGGAIITWQDERAGGMSDDIYVQRIDSTGAVKWTDNGTAICTEDYSQGIPQICSDGAGGAIITWVDYRTGGDPDIYAQRINSSGGIEWTSNGTAVCTELYYQMLPQICSDGAGGAIITWVDNRLIGWQIYAQRINSNGGIEWTGNGTIICTADPSQFNHQICSDGAGGAIITWCDSRGTDDDIYAQLIDSTGAVKWTSNGTAICTAGNNQQMPQLCSDGSGGAIITWQDERAGGTSDDIYAQRINSTGAVKWTGNGTAICTATFNQSEPQLCSDGTGGAIITWSDYRIGSNDIYAQRINSSGGIEWTSNGTAICTAAFAQSKPQLCNDSGGGAVITWQSERIGGIWDIYAQRIDLMGAIRWTSNGIVICKAANNQYDPQICSDGAVGAIVTWCDERSGTNSDIYVRHVRPGEFPWYLLFLLLLGQPEEGIIEILFSLLGLLVITGIIFVVITVVVVNKKRK